MYADVLILNPDSNHDQILTYRIPPGLGLVGVGTLVSVPLRRLTRRGLVLDVSEDKPNLVQLKDIGEIIGEEPILNSCSVTLARWLSAYYLCSLNKAVPLFLPPPLRQQEIQLLVPGPGTTGDQLFLAEMEQKVLTDVVDNFPPGLKVEKVVKKYGPKGQQALLYLLEKAILQKITRYVNMVQPRQCIMVKLSLQAPAWEAIKKKAPRQAAVLHYLERGPSSLADLKKALGSVQAAVNALQEKGWLEVSKERDDRQPIGQLMQGHRPSTLNPEQSGAVRAIRETIHSGKYRSFLLYGVTGSGKTEVYLRAIEETRQRGRQVLFLVPEIGLTPQVTSLLYHSFGRDLALLHSALTPGERHDEWMRIKRGEAKIVLGPRSAVFAPFSDLGLVIIDEEHENTYKQNEPDPRYDARRVASKLAEEFQAALVMGSATPSLETYRKALDGEYELLRLPSRVAARPQPTVEIVDMRKEQKKGNMGIFSSQLVTALERVIKEGEQAILFINRRGYHTYVQCRECGHTLLCPHCSITLTYHRKGGLMVCHYCGYHRPAPGRCPSCGSRFIRYAGTGTERVADELTRLFPAVSLVRMDTDTTRQRGSHTEILKGFQEGKWQVLVGTQMVTKGLDFPAVTLVGVINADIILNMPDYQAGERAYQLLAQAAGRAGRGHGRGEVVIQTYLPAHHLFQAVINHDYECFYQTEMENRLLMQYPPYCRLIRVLVTGAQEKKVVDRVDYLTELLKIELGKKGMSTEILGPAPAPLECINGRWRYHFILKGIELETLRMLAGMVKEKASRLSPEPRIIIDIEPKNML